jgi:hypothetical protein
MRMTDCFLDGSCFHNIIPSWSSKLVFETVDLSLWKAWRNIFNRVGITQEIQIIHFFRLSVGFLLQRKQDIHSRSVRLLKESKEFAQWATVRQSSYHEIDLLLSSSSQSFQSTTAFLFLVDVPHIPLSTWDDTEMKQCDKLKDNLFFILPKTERRSSGSLSLCKENHLQSSLWKLLGLLPRPVVVNRAHSDEPYASVWNYSARVLFYCPLIWLVLGLQTP